MCEIVLLFRWLHTATGVRHIIGTNFHVHLLVHTTCYIHHYLHEGLEVVVSIHLLHIVSQHFITEDILILVREESGMLHGCCMPHKENSNIQCWVWLQVSGYEQTWWPGRHPPHLLSSDVPTESGYTGTSHSSQPHHWERERVSMKHADILTWNTQTCT